MFIAQKHVLFSLALIIHSLGIIASELELKTKAHEASSRYFPLNWIPGRSAFQPQPKRTVPGEIQQRTQLPTDISNLIGQYAEEYGPYKKIKTLNKPGTLLGISDDDEGIVVTSAFNSNGVAITKYNVNNNRETDLEIQQAQERLLLSGNGKVLITPDNNQFVDTITGNPVTLLTEQDKKSADRVHNLLTFHKFLKNGGIPIFLNYDGTKVAAMNDRRILFYKFKDQKSLFLQEDIYPYDNFHNVGESRLSLDENTFAYCYGHDNPHIKLFDANNGTLKSQYITSLRITSFDINHDGSQLFYSGQNKETRSDSAILVDLNTNQQKEIFSTSGLKKGRIYQIGFVDLDNVYIASMIKQQTFFKKASRKNFIRIYNLATDKIEEISLGQDPYIPTITFNPDNTVLAIGSSNDVEIFKRSTKTEEAQAELEKKRTIARETEANKDTQALERERLEQQKSLQNQKAYKEKRDAIQQGLSAMHAMQRMTTLAPSKNPFYKAAELQKKSTVFPKIDQNLSPSHLEPAVEPID